MSYIFPVHEVMLEPPHETGPLGESRWVHPLAQKWIDEAGLTDDLKVFLAEGKMNTVLIFQLKDKPVAYTLSMDDIKAAIDKVALTKEAKQ